MKNETFDALAAVIRDRKKNPAEGSYTCYLFEKGLDKILKKVGEEASEVIIAAKNGANDELCMGGLRLVVPPACPLRESEPARGGYLRRAGSAQPKDWQSQADEGC